MKVQPITSFNTRVQKNRVSNNYVVHNPMQTITSNSVRIISFGNNPNGVTLFVGSECPPLFQKGGQGTVMRDYNDLGPAVIPYYNGKKVYDEKGEVVKKTEVLKYDGKKYVADIDFDTVKFEDVMTATKDQPELFKLRQRVFEIETVGKPSTMQWGKTDATPIELLKVVKGLDDAQPMKKDIYLVFTDATSKMRGPYEGTTLYSSEGLSAKITAPEHWEGDYFAKFDKALVKLLPDSGIKPAHVVLSDSHTFYIPEFMKQELEKKPNGFFKGMKNVVVEHNIQDGYNCETSAKSMFINMGATRAEIEQIVRDPEFMEAVDSDAYFKRLLNSKAIAENGTCTPNQLVIDDLKNGYISRIITVSEGYAESAANNPRVTPTLYKELHELFAEGKFIGILNALNNPDMTFNRPVKIAGYSKQLTRTIGDKTFTFEPTKPFTFGIQGIEQMLQEDAAKEVEKLDDNEILKGIRAIRAENKRNLLQRFSGEFREDAELLAGLPHKKVKLYGHIDPKYAESADTKLFVSWGRVDLQKGLDTVLDAFKKLVNSGDKNSVLIFGGETLPDGEESKALLSLMGNLPDKLKGRVAFLDGFAPNAPFAAAADAAIFPSRFAPCELTDLEAMKYFCTPIVTNTQGLKQKNFDPRIEAEKLRATSYRTQTGFLEQSYEDLVKVLDGDSKEVKQQKEELKSFVDTTRAKIKTKLQNRGVKAEQIEELVEKELWKDKSVNNAIRKFTDNKIADELVVAMRALLSRSEQDELLMYKNQMKTITTWNGNALLHPSNKSTLQMYKEAFEAGINEKNAKPLRRILAINSYGPKAETPASFGNVLDTAADTAKDAAKSNKHVGLWITGAAVVLGAVGYYLYNNSNTNVPKEKPQTQQGFKTYA